MTLVIIELNPTKRVFGAQLSDSSVPVKCSVREGKIHTILKEMFKSLTLMQTTHFLDLTMCGGILAEVVPKIEQSLQVHTLALLGQSACLPHAGGDGMEDNRVRSGSGHTWKPSNTQFTQLSLKRYTREGHVIQF